MCDSQNSENMTQVVENCAFLMHLCKILSKKAQSRFKIKAIAQSNVKMVKPGPAYNCIHQITQLLSLYSSVKTNTDQG